MAPRILHSAQGYHTKQLTRLAVQEMSRPKDTIRVSLKSRDGKTARLNIVPAIDGGFIVYRDGKIREKLSATEFGRRMAAWIKSQG